MRETSYDTHRRLGRSEAEEARAVAEFNRLLAESHPDMNGDPAAARLLAVDRFERVWGVSAFAPDAAGTVLPYPVEKAYRQAPGGGHGYVRDQAEAEVAARGLSARRVFVSPNALTGADRRKGLADSAGFGPRMILSIEDAEGHHQIVDERFQARVPGTETPGG